MTNLGEEIIARLDGDLTRSRGNFPQLWEEIREFVQPVAVNFTANTTAGRKLHHRIVDNTAEGASEQLAATLYGWLGVGQGRMFRFKAGEGPVEEESHASREWMGFAERDVARIMESPNSGFESAVLQTIATEIDYGTAGCYAADRPGNIPLIQARPLAELYLAENADEQVDTVYRKLQMTARQIEQRVKAGEFRAAPEPVAKALEGNRPDQQFEVVHAVEPDGKPDERPFRSAWVLRHNKQILREGRFFEQPTIVGRWKVIAGEVYGRSPGMKALADIKMLQRAMQVQVRGSEKMVDPPMLMPDDGAVLGLNMAPNATNYARFDAYYNRKSPIEFLHTNGRIDVGENLLDQIRRRVEMAYYGHLIRLAHDQRFTATQVLRLTEDSQRAIGPFLGRIQSEILSPLIQRIFAIRQRAGHLPPPPPELQGRRLQVEFITPMARARRVGEVQAIAQWIELLKMLAEQDPSVLDVVEEERTGRHLGENLSVPMRLIRSPDAVAQRRQAREQQAAQAAEMEGLERGAAAAQSAGQAVAALASAGSGVPPTGGNAPRQGQTRQNRPLGRRRNAA